MIITLRGADFSSNNINDMLNSYFITVQGSNLTHNLVGSVDKETNSGVSGTITINDGYVFDESGTLVVKMGTQTLSGVANIAEDGMTITITISQKITGNVVITVPTKSVGGEEPDTPTNYTFTINPTPTSATVTLSATGYSDVSGTGSQSITVANGTEVNWSVSADGYTTRTGNWTANGQDETLPVALAAAGEIVELTTANGTKISTTEIVGTTQTIGAEVYYDSSAGTKGIYTWEIPAYAQVTVTAGSGGNYGIALTDTNNIVIAYVLSSAATSPYTFPVSLTPTRLHFSSTKFVSASYTILTEEDIAGMAFPISVNLQADNTKYVSATQTVGNDVALAEMGGTGYYISTPIPANATVTIKVATGGSYGMVLADTNGKVLESKPSSQADADGNITFTKQSVETLLYASKTKYSSGTYTLA